MVNYYKILKISSKANAAEIKSAYRRLARKKHPDVNDGKESASREFARIAKAYKVLSNPQERAFYDKKLLEFEFYGSRKEDPTILDSDNPHAQRLRRMAYEKRYNAIVDRMISEERKESLALQKVIFPTVALFLSTCFVGIFKPMFWTNSPFLGKAIFVVLFVVGVLHIFRRFQEGFERYTYTHDEDLHDSILDQTEPAEKKPYSRFTAVSFLIIGFFVSLGIGIFIGNYLELFVTASMPMTYSHSLRPELLFYPPIVVLAVDLMHSFAARLDY